MSTTAQDKQRTPTKNDWYWLLLVACLILVCVYSHSVLKSKNKALKEEIKTLSARANLSDSERQLIATTAKVETMEIVSRELQILVDQIPPAVRRQRDE